MYSTRTGMDVDCRPISASGPDNGCFICCTSTIGHMRTYGMPMMTGERNPNIQQQHR